eukprot:6379678-Pyramimonas_sp.AAC.2
MFPRMFAVRTSWSGAGPRGCFEWSGTPFPCSRSTFCTRRSSPRSCTWGVPAPVSEPGKPGANSPAKKAG